MAMFTTRVLIAGPQFSAGISNAYATFELCAPEV